MKARKRLFAQTVELHGAEFCCFKLCDKFHVILLLLQEAPNHSGPYGPHTHIIGHRRPDGSAVFVKAIQRRMIGNAPVTHGSKIETAMQIEVS